MAGHFFSVSAEVINLIVKQTKWEDAVLGYLVLAKHARPKSRTTTAGALALINRLGLTRYKADEVLARLKEVRWGAEVTEAAVVDYRLWRGPLSQEPAILTASYPTKVLPDCGEKRIYLPNALVEGIGAGKEVPPLMRLRAIQPKQDRLDVVRLLIKLYEEHSYVDYGGVNPNIVRREWQYSGFHHDGCTKLGYQGSSPTAQRTFHFWMIQKPSGPPLPGKEFLDQFMAGDEQRFQRAFTHLAQLHLLYEVGMVFDDDPLINPGAEMLYPLYVWDRTLREKAFDDDTGLGGLWKEAFSRLERTYLVDDLRYLIFSDGSASSRSGSGLFVYAADSAAAKVFTVYRLKYLPHTKDTGAGVEAERVRTATWKHSLDYESFGKQTPEPSHV